MHSLIPCNNSKLTVNKQVTMTIITIIITVQMITKFQEGTHLPTWSPLQYIQTRCMYQRNPLICFPTYCTWYIICYHFFFTLFLIQSIIIHTERKTHKKLIEIKCTFDSFQIKSTRLFLAAKSTQGNNKHLNICKFYRFKLHVFVSQS